MNVIFRYQGLKFSRNDDYSNQHYRVKNIYKAPKDPLKSSKRQRGKRHSHGLIRCC